MRRAAKLGDGWHPYMYTADRCKISFSQVKEYASEAGRTLPGDYVWAVFVYTSLDDDVEEARAQGIKEMSFRYEQDFGDLVEKYCAYGSPQRMIDYLAGFIEAGVNYFILAPIMPPDRRREHLERMASEVLPALEKMEPAAVQ